MSDFFDEKITDSKDSETKESEKIEKRPKKKNGFVTVIIYALCAGIIVGACFGVKKLIPKKKSANQDNTSSSADTSEKEFSVLDLKLDDVKEVTVENSKTTLNFYSEKDTSGTEDKLNWYLSGAPKELLSSVFVEDAVTKATSISATKKVTGISLSECGFDKPAIKVEVLGIDNKVTSFAIGNDAALGDNCYLKFDDKDDIYTVKKSLKTALDVDALSFASISAMPTVEKENLSTDYYENGALIKCDMFTVTGKNFPIPLKIEPNDDKQISEYLPYMVTSPEKHLADAGKIDKLFQMFDTGIQSEGIYSYYSEQLSPFGLDKPDFAISMTIGKQTVTYRFSLQSDGDYAGWSNIGNVIYKISQSSLSEVIDSKATDYYSSLVCLYSIDEINSLSIKTKDGEYIFGVSANENSTDKDDDYSITCDSKKIECRSFKNFYQFLISLSCYDYSIDKVSSDDAITVSFNSKSGSNVVEFVRADETRYQYSLNGKAMGKVSSSKLNKIVKYAKKLANGEKIGELS